MNVDQILSYEEKQIFERKSIKVDPKDLAILLCAFANADGGTVAIGVSDKSKRIEGVDFDLPLLNELLRVPIDYCNPTIEAKTEFVPCTDNNGRKNHILLIHVDASPKLHANQADEVYLRIGDKSKKLKFEDRLTLMYSKGLRYYENEICPNAEISDLDFNFINSYLQHIGYRKSALEYLQQNKNFIVKKDGKNSISNAAILLFGKSPQCFFPRARIRFIKYRGVEAKVGREMNVVKDEIFEGKLLEQLKQAIDFIKTQIEEKTYLGKNGVFVKEEEYSEFVRTEIIVNAVTHRDYSIKGTDIQIKMFDDRLEVDSPGTFAGMVTKENIRYTHFSRNPVIAAFLKDYDYVKEYGEGVDRIFKEMEACGLSAPLYDDKNFIMKSVVQSKKNIFGDLDKQKSAVQKEKIGGLDNKKSAVNKRSLNNDIYVTKNKKVGGLDNKKSAVRKQKVGGLNKQKSAVQKIVELCKNADYAKPTIDKITKIYLMLKDTAIFSAINIKQSLNCADSTARQIIDKMKRINLVVPIKGYGKGKYRFI